MLSDRTQMQLFIKIYYGSVQKYDNKSYDVRKLGKKDQKVEIAAIQSITILNHLLSANHCVLPANPICKKTASPNILELAIIVTP
ncbi:hypothetical protein CA600_24610 [Paenibacillus sp. VTT E-133280]|nr:hypothetical protein CA600_24610 [Paenibacillus sp. VTT E-133280]